MNNCKIMVMGVGNILMTDEGAGIHALAELAKQELPPGTELLEGGTAGMELLHLIEDVDHLVIIDSVEGGTEPGAIFRFKPDDISVIPSEFNVSFHQVGLIEVLKMGQILGKLPRSVVIFGIQPYSLDWGMELSQPVSAKMPALIKLVVDEVWSITHEYKNLK